MTGSNDCLYNCLNWADDVSPKDDYPTTFIRTICHCSNNNKQRCHSSKAYKVVLSRRCSIRKLARRNICCSSDSIRYMSVLIVGTSEVTSLKAPPLLLNARSSIDIAVIEQRVCTSLDLSCIHNALTILSTTAQMIIRTFV